MPEWQLRFPLGDIKKWASHYSYPDEGRVVERIGPAARSRGYLTRDDFVELCRWKSPRTVRHVESNGSDLVEEATSLALGASSEELRVGILFTLRGVSWPTASVILHFCATDPYPILDFRALYSLNVPMPRSYSFPFWWQYTEVVRALAHKSGLDMRTIDRALWQYSKEHQPPGG